MSRFRMQRSGKLKQVFTIFRTLLVVFGHFVSCASALEFYQSAILGILLVRH